MHMVSLPTKEDVRMPEADPKFRGETWQTATEAQARLALIRLPLAPLMLILCSMTPYRNQKSHCTGMESTAAAFLQNVVRLQKAVLGSVVRTVQLLCSRAAVAIRPLCSSILLQCVASLVVHYTGQTKTRGRSRSVSAPLAPKTGTLGICDCGRC